MASGGYESDLDTSSSSEEEGVTIALSPAPRAHSADLAQQSRATEARRHAYLQDKIGRVVFILRWLPVLAAKNEASDNNRVVSAPTANKNPHLSVPVNSGSPGAVNKRVEPISESSTESEIGL